MKIAPEHAWLVREGQHEYLYVDEDEARAFATNSYREPGTTLELYAGPVVWVVEHHADYEGVQLLSVHRSRAGAVAGRERRIKGGAPSDDVKVDVWKLEE